MPPRRLQYEHREMRRAVQGGERLTNDSDNVMSRRNCGRTRVSVLTVRKRNLHPIERDKLSNGSNNQQDISQEEWLII